MLRNALTRYTSFVGSAATFPSKGKAHCRVLFCRQRFSDSVGACPFFFLRRKKNLKKKELQGGYPLDPRLRWRHHNRMGKQWENSVQVAQRGQIKARTVKRSAANYPWLPLEGKAERTVFAPNTETFSAVYVASVSYRSRLARSPGGLGGREPVAAQSP